MKNSNLSNRPLCECGCENPTKGGRFLPGHDAKLKSALVTGALAGSKRAKNKLELLGWSKFLDAKLAKQGTKEPLAESVEPAVERPRRGRKKADAPVEVPQQGEENPGSVASTVERTCEDAS